MTKHLTRWQVLASSNAMPAFPRVIEQILATLEDPDASLKLLAAHVEQDPVITARVLALANAAGAHTQRRAAMRDVYSATSLIGLSRLRDMAIMSGLLGFFDTFAPPDKKQTYWQHSVAVGICCAEVAAHAPAASLPQAPLIAGLLHDIGQLWLYRFEAEAYRAAWDYAQQHQVSIDVAEREQFGVDHARIGAWLVASWNLPENIYNAIAQHHAPDESQLEPLVAVVHVAEVVGNALGLVEREGNRVTTLSAPACAMLGIKWDASAQQLFGRIEARSSQARSFFSPP